MDDEAHTRDLCHARDDDVVQIRDALRFRLQASGKTQRDIERANDFAPRYLSQVLSGSITLTVRHLIGILRALDVTPLEFFTALEDGATAPPEPVLSEIRERMARYDALFDQLTSKGVLAPEEPTS